MTDSHLLFACGFLLLGCVVAQAADSDNVNVCRVQAIDSSAWIWADEKADVCLFRCRFASGDETVRLHVSADNRYELRLDGARIGRGPDRGSLERWTYRTHDLALTAGEHVLEAIVTRGGAPLAQLQWDRTGGFIVKAEGRLDAALSTGTAPWRVCTFDNVRDLPGLPEAFGVGGAVELVGNSPWFAQPDVAAFAPAVVVREPVGTCESYGTMLPGWRLFPTTLPPQLSERKRPGRIVAVAPTVARDHVYVDNEAGGDFPTRVPAHTAVTYLWDLGDYYCAWPSVEVTGGAGAKIELGWAESLVDAQSGLKRQRGEFVGKRFYGLTDVFRPTGGRAGFATKWWRCGRWVRLAVETGDEPLEIRALTLDETRYPTPYTGSFACEDASVGAIQTLMTRTLQLCTHEMSFDCPYYEQQMYPGDTRLQLLVHTVLADDDRLIMRDIDLYDESRRANGLIGFNYPTSKRQEGAAYTFMYPMMLADYAAWHTDRAWLRRKLTGLVHVMEGLNACANETGLVVNLPGWNFQDWALWPEEGCPAGSHEATGTNAVNNLLYAYALDSAVSVAEALDEPVYAALWRDRKRKAAAAIDRLFWDEARGLYADDTAHRSFSEHAQSLALTTGVATGTHRERVAAGLLTDPSLVRCTVYFKHYLYEAYAALGRTDLIVKDLDLWRGYLKKGLKTSQESPDEMRYDLAESRSDCHAWGAHPIYHFHRNILGLRPTAPFLGEVEIAPAPGGWREIRSVTPTSRGEIRCELTFDGDRVKGTITLPKGLTGRFVYRNQTQVLAAGENQIGMGN